MKEIQKALLLAQMKIENAHKDSDNPHFRSTYASLESVLGAVKDHANNCGILIIQEFGKDSEGHFCETKLLHESGEMISSKCYLVLDKQNMQGMGSALTYARRYTLAGLFAIGQEDDDGNKAASQSISSHYRSQSTFAPPPGHLAEIPPMDMHIASSGSNPNYIGYKIGIGKKYLGKLITEIPRADVASFANWLRDSAKKPGAKPLDEKALSFLKIADEYIASGEYK